MIEILMPALWTSFGAYALWYLTKAKSYAPITAEEARLLWTIHKRSSRCNGTEWQKITRGKKIVGFECRCGYKHVQKRPIVANVPQAVPEPPVSTLDRLHSPYKSP